MTWVCVDTISGKIHRSAKQYSNEAKREAAVALGCEPEDIQTVQLKERPSGI